MNRILQVINSVGVIALAVLCCVQWQANRRVNLQAIALEHTRIEQEARIAAQEKTIHDGAADLDEFRQRLTQMAADLKKAQDQIGADSADRAHLAAESGHLTAERDQLKSSLDKWVAAVAARDEALRRAGTQLQALGAERNDAVKKFNDLAAKYNTLGPERDDAIKKFNDLATKFNALVSERDDTVKKFNDLAAKYNALVKDAGAAKTGQ